MAALPASLPAWLDSMVAVDTFFSPCERCAVALGGRGGTRDRQANFFVVNGARALTACSHCKPALEAGGAVTLQIRRSSHHDVVKIADMQKLCPQAVQSVQSYTINGQKVAFLRRRPVPKEARAGPMCVSCCRSLQDNNAFCSLECKRAHTASQPMPSLSTSSASSGGSPLTPAAGKWGSFNTFYASSGASHSSSDDLYSPPKKRRKSAPRRSPWE